MAFRAHALRVLIDVDPVAARGKILEAFVKARASRTAAASVLGCRRSTFNVWVAKLGMEQDLRAAEEIAKREGWHHCRRGGAAWHRNRRAGSSEPY